METTTMKVITLTVEEIKAAVVAYYKLSNNTMVKNLAKTGMVIIDYGDEKIKIDNLSTFDSIKTKLLRVNCRVLGIADKFRCTNVDTAKTFMYNKNYSIYNRYLKKEEGLTEDIIKSKMVVEETKEEI